MKPTIFLSSNYRDSVGSMAYNGCDFGYSHQQIFLNGTVVVVLKGFDSRESFVDGFAGFNWLHSIIPQDSFPQ